MPTTRINIRTLANSAAIRRERRNGRDKIIVPSATLPDDVIMNGVKYPADEIEKGYASLNGTLAPLGHPTIEGMFVSASHPDGISIGWIGAHNENVRRENGRVLLDKVIDVARAKESDGGRAVLEAIEKGQPIHTSTGLWANMEDEEGEGYKQVARNLEFDHDAILLGEQGAATPEQGVGMLVNSAGEVEEVPVINSTFEESAERELDWAVDHLARALESRQRVSMLERMKTALADLFGEGTNPSTNSGEEKMDKAQFDELSAKVNNLADSAVTKDDLANALKEALKPITDAQTEMQANQKAEAEAKRTELVNKVIEAKIDGLDKDAIDKMDDAALNALLTMHNKQKSKPAAPLASGFAINMDKDDDMSPFAWGTKL